MHKRPQAIIFDMDGTLTRPLLDFDAIRREIGLPPGPVLEAIREMPPQRQAEANAILDRHEAEAAAACELQDHAAEVVSAIRESGTLAALMTRNSRRSVLSFLDTHRIAFDLTWSREDGPMKPSPEPIHRICQRLGVPAADTWSIGDYYYDLVCSRAAGARAILLLTPDRPRPDWADEADDVIASLAQLLTMMGIERPDMRPA